eukprot:COSAG01_NODE_66593_length_269_cov_1.435294_1_plen_50_part_10
MHAEYAGDEGTTVAGEAGVKEPSGGALAESTVATPSSDIGTDANDGSCTM